jgi:hypothetical protein
MTVSFGARVSMAPDLIWSAVKPVKATQSSREEKAPHREVRIPAAVDTIERSAAARWPFTGNLS